MGDKIELTGDFRGSIVNIKSRLENVTQTVGEIRGGDEETRKELQKLIQQLSEALEKAPPAKKEQVEAVAETAKALVDQAKGEKPNKTMLQITGEGLKQAAKNVGDVLPGGALHRLADRHGDRKAGRVEPFSDDRTACSTPRRRKRGKAGSANRRYLQPLGRFSRRGGQHPIHHRRRGRGARTGGAAARAGRPALPGPAVLRRERRRPFLRARAAHRQTGRRAWPRTASWR